MNVIHYLPGGGLGDVFRECVYHNAVGILQRWKLEHPEARLKVFMMSHNPSSVDLLAGQPWIDELVCQPFPLSRTWAWEDAYNIYKDDFKGHVELRFSLNESRSLYASQFNSARPRRGRGEIVYADPIGMMWRPTLSDEDREAAEQFRDRLVFHPAAGQESRALPATVAKVLAPFKPLTVGANYKRLEHATEGGITVSPRVLVEGMRIARAVVGSESSVWYLGTMLGIPAAVFYHRNATFDKAMNQRTSTWNWYFGTTNPANLNTPLPFEKDREEKLVEWVNRVMHR